MKHLGDITKIRGHEVSAVEAHVRIFHWPGKELALPVRDLDSTWSKLELSRR